MASIAPEQNSNNFLGRLVKNIKSDEFSSDILQDCVCIYVGSRGRTFFNLTVSVAGIVRFYNTVITIFK